MNNNELIKAQWKKESQYLTTFFMTILDSYIQPKVQALVETAQLYKQTYHNSRFLQQKKVIKETSFYFVYQNTL